jgi:pyruvate,orthophosphate dikinase
VANQKFVYFFGNSETEGKNSMKNLLGGKGANLAEMASMGIPVPSGARVSMPGMMDTVLNLGLNDRSVLGLVRKSNNERFAYDSYRRFLTMFGDVVLDIEYANYESIIDEVKKEKGAKLDTELDVDALKELVEKFKVLIKKKTGEDFPQDPRKQLQMSIDAVFGSWNNQRANTYRRLNNIPGDWGTAVNVQTMVYGNMGETSGTGVAFTRDPATGEKRFFGEYLINAQGEDVVAGIRTPQPIETLKDKMPESNSPSRMVSFTCSRQETESELRLPQLRSQLTWWMKNSSIRTLRFYESSLNRSTNYYIR